MTLIFGNTSINPGGSSEDYYTKEEMDTALAGKANVATTLTGYGITDGANIALSNLSADGQMIIDSQNGTISNCVLEIPQNIKLTLENNVLTLKSGSVLTDSGTTYQTITITSDKTNTIPTSSNNRWLIFATRTGILAPVVINSCVSGETDSLSGQPIHIWFDTTNQEVLYYGSDGTTGSHRTYPLCVINVVGGVASFAKDSNGNDMIFNGAGFIGHHAFVYPNVKALIPNGFNADGSLASIIGKVNSLIIYEMPTSTNRWLSISSDGRVFTWTSYDEVDTYSDANFSILYKRYYIKDENSIRVNNGSSIIKEISVGFIKLSYDGTTVTDFAIRQPVRTATVEMLKDKQNDLTTVSGYDATTTQVLKHVNGILTWVTEE